MAMKTYYRCALASIALAACAFDTGRGPEPVFEIGQLAPPPIDYVALLGHPNRPSADFADDALRKPADVLAFTGVGYGMTVIDMEAGGGYYTELFSHAVGSEGRVYMQNPIQFDAFLGDAVQTRLADDRLANVTVMRTPFDKLEVASGSADLVTWFLGPHELWFTPQGAPEGVLGDPDATFAEIARALAPGGSFVALDHMAAQGAPETTGGDTHRIDPDIIIARAEAAGLVLADTSSVLASEYDDYSVNVFDPSVRRKTDRFLLRFEKPTG